MLCRRCQALAAQRRRTEPRIPLAERDRAAGRITGDAGDRLCSSCGGLLGADETTQRVDEKHSQLARFGLADPQPLINGREPGTG